MRKLSLEELLSEYINKTETNFQNQQASIKNLEQQAGQIVAIIANRPSDTLSSDIEKNIRSKY